MKNLVYPVYRDTQLTNSSFRFLRLIISVWKFRNQTNPDASVNLVFVKHDYFRPLKITAANKAVQFIALAARTIP
jgi:signal recognition particle subunit SEC65